MTQCIFLDMDGTIIDLMGGVFKNLFNVDPELKKEIFGWDAAPGVISKALNREVTNEEFWSKINDAGSDFWADLDWLPWGKELLSRCYLTAPTVLMSTPTRHPSCVSGKIKWIDKNIHKDKKRDYALTPCKYYMAREDALLIDDGPHNIEKFKNHGGYACEVPMPWNSFGRWPTEGEVLAKASSYLF